MTDSGSGAAYARFLLWPDPVHLRPQEIKHDRIREGEMGIAWYQGDDADGWRKRPIAQNSYPTDTAIKLLQGAALAEEVMRSEGGPKPGVVVLQYFAPDEWVPGPGDPMHATLLAGIRIDNEPANSTLAEHLGMELLRFGAEPDDPEDEEVTIALYPLPLGAIVRLPQDRKYPGTDAALVSMEYIDLLNAVLAGEGEDYSDRILKHAIGGV